MNWVKSKTVWFNFLFLLVVIANAFGFQEFQPDDWAKDFGETIGTLILIGGNIFLRFKTTKAVWDK